MFTGRVRLRNGGPACISCHSIASVPFPNGGTMGPDLTREYSKLGPQGLHYALQTLYFPAMNALFGNRLLTPDEQANLAAFLQQTDQQPPPSKTTRVVAAVGFAGFLVLLGVTGLAGRGRVHSVRRRLLKRADVSGESKP